MKKNAGSCFVLLLLIVFQVLLLNEIQTELQKKSFPYELAFQHFRNHEITMDMVHEILENCEYDMETYAAVLTTYFAKEEQETSIDNLKNEMVNFEEANHAEYVSLEQLVYSVWSCVSHFPVGRIVNQNKYTVNYANGWMDSRSYGGERVHEGTDIMASPNTRAIYPIYSVSDGVVEKTGWLKLGGYRVGIRSDTGVYFYYAHLAEYADDLIEGSYIKAGTLIGYMGDTGYSEIPGTTGNFDVHLHFGIYVTDKNGNEQSINPYPVLQYLWNDKKNNFKQE